MLTAVIGLLIVMKKAGFRVQIKIRLEFVKKRARAKRL